MICQKMSHKIREDFFMSDQDNLIQKQFLLYDNNKNIVTIIQINHIKEFILKWTAFTGFILLSLLIF